MADTTPKETAAAPSSSSSLSRPTNARLPSLAQIAARVNSSSPSTTPRAGSRLPTNILRSNSSISTATASSTDSTAVVPPKTRPISPTEPSDAASPDSVSTPTVPPPVADASSTPPEGIPAPIVDREEKKIRGYKNIPSLDAITERMRRAKLADASATAPANSVAPEVGTAVTTESTPDNEETKDSVTPTKGGEHPLQHTWTLYHDTKSKVPYTPFTATAGNGETTPFVPTSTESGAYEAGLTVVGEFNTVEGFCRYFNWLKPPSKLERNSNYHLFKDGIKPMWEDPANANGGKWVLTMKNNPMLLDRCWSWLAMALVGEELDEKDEVCGAVVSLRAKIDRIQVWTRGKENVEAINALGKKLIKLLDLQEEPGIGLEFQYNTEDKPTPTKFLSIQAQYPQYGGGAYGRSPHTANAPSFPLGGGGVHPATTHHGSGSAALDGAGGAFAWRSRKQTVQQE